MSVQHINPDSLFKLDGFAQISVPPAGKRLAHIAGQTALDTSLQLPSRDFHDQVVLAFRNVAHALAALGATTADVVSMTFYIVGLTDEKFQRFVAAMNVALDGQPFPANASSVIGIERLALEGLEIEMTTVVAID
ncbi:Enamine deaminase RidA, house cleaning of reactive enamine intermediates, YjgF/YER057c/UK114 family [Sphingomonas laterariae]|uniref:Enamine deaminase RidA, house cleaning of reactive enamine intermediates, YjgF/YER057c/UK114 family n=1 Tax=Edaphosphingomonas laterariae TaxID=861865 RepID=A0A239EEN3_9SPHN|nr:Rid family hydrolase [Sphingomonas laterariae]SNS42901.1 Enamine deaminase RidA, house cleaning of reactive enamine intermediates, YjgF/YER057c/UK114 family [Sphingomonas laterariae]